MINNGRTNIVLTLIVFILILFFQLIIFRFFSNTNKLNNRFSTHKELYDFFSKLIYKDEGALNFQNGNDNYYKIHYNTTIPTNNISSFLPVSYSGETNKFNYFQIEAKKDEFFINFHSTNSSQDTSAGLNRIKLLGIINKIKNLILYVVFLDENHQVFLMRYDYNRIVYGEKVKLYINDMEFKYHLHQKSEIIKINSAVLVMLDNRNVVHMKSFEEDNENLIFYNKLSLDNVILPSECYMYKVVDIEHFVTLDQKYLVFGLIYYCADLNEINLTYSNIFLKFNIKMSELKFNIVHNFKIMSDFQSQDLGKIKEYLSKLPTQFKNRIKINKITPTNVKGEPTLLINLENKVDLIQKFFYDKNLGETNFKIYNYTGLDSQEKTVLCGVTKTNYLIQIKIPTNNRNILKLSIHNLIETPAKTTTIEKNIYLPKKFNLTDNTIFKQLDNGFLLYDKINSNVSVVLEVNDLFTPNDDLSTDLRFYSIGSVINTICIIMLFLLIIYKY